MNNNSSALLINEGPLQVLPSLAVAIGLNEALALQQLHYRLRSSKKIRDDRKWVYDSYEEWQQEHFPFWSARTVQRAFLKLEELQLVIAETPGGRDRRKWYTIDYDHVNRLISDPHTYNQELMQSLGGSSEAESEDDTTRQVGTVDDAGMRLSDVPSWHAAPYQVGTMDDATLARPSNHSGTLLNKAPETPPKTSPENTRTPSRVRALSSGSDGREVCACETPHKSKLCDEERIRIAANISTIRNPQGYAMAPEVRRGRDDALLLKRQRELQPPTASASPPERDTRACPDCHGTGFWYPQGHERGAAKCKHPRLDDELRRLQDEYAQARRELAAT